MIVACVEALTASVVTGKVALLAFAATVTLAGTLALLLLLPSETEMLLVVAPDSVTVPVDGLGPTTVAGLRPTEESVSGLMVSAAAGGVTELYVPEMCAVTALLTAVVVIANVAVVDPAATVTVDGTAAAALSLAKFTITPGTVAG